MHIFLTGERRIGKSTILDRVIKLSKAQLLGFQTRPSFDPKACLTGFVLQDLTGGTSAVIGSLTDAGLWVGHPEVFDDIGVRAVSFDKESLEDWQRRGHFVLLIMDELGFFEQDASCFQEQVFRCLDQERIPVLGVLKRKRTPFLDAVSTHPKVSLFCVEEANREVLPEVVLQRIRRDFWEKGQ